MENIIIRPSTADAAEEILKIYEYYIKNTAITFEYDVPALQDFRARIENTLKRYPYFAAVKDGHIIGYTYAGPFIGRAAYDWSAETTIYLAPDAAKLGLGRKLYEALEAALRQMGIQNLYACIGYPDKEDQCLTKNSAEFHSHLDLKQWANFINAAINWAAGTI